MFDAGKIKRFYALQKIYLPAGREPSSLFYERQKTMHRHSTLPPDEPQHKTICQVQQRTDITYIPFVPDKVNRELAGLLLFSDSYPLTT